VSPGRSELPKPTHLALGVADLAASLVLDVAAPVNADAFHFGFHVAGDTDVEAWAARLRERGATTVAGPAPRPTLRTLGSVVTTIDPDGHKIEIYSGD